MYEQINCRKCSEVLKNLDSTDVMTKAADAVFMNLVSIKEDGSTCIGLYHCPRCGHQETVGEVSNIGDLLTVRRFAEEITVALENNDKERLVALASKKVHCEYCNHAIHGANAIEQLNGHVVLACPDCKQPWAVPSLKIRTTGCVVTLLVLGAFVMAMLIGSILLIKRFLAR
jgi:hypothetical protein